MNFAAIFQRTRSEINLCNLDVSSYIVVRDATCTLRRHFFWRTRFRSVHAFARRGETEDMSRAVDLLPARSTGTRPRGKIWPRLLHQPICQATDSRHDEEKNQEERIAIPLIFYLLVNHRVFLCIVVEQSSLKSIRIIIYL